ncbi:MAG TPA: riboflavin synthase [Acidimicrobiia bacterium]|nr:riboflavin synthase [Acidimicrobiia bacterium]
MFTGIVEAVGAIGEATEVDGGRRFRIAAPSVAPHLEVGDSVAVQGVCLTATSATDREFAVELVAETVARTTLGVLVAGDPVNLERAMRADGRFDGHIVQGHVDGVGVVRSVEAEGRGKRIWVDCPAEVRRYVVRKGSITIDGVSLTVAGLDEEGFEVALIPHTLEVTTLGLLEPDATVNLEADILAKYVERLMDREH